MGVRVWVERWVWGGGRGGGSERLLLWCRRHGCVAVSLPSPCPKTLTPHCDDVPSKHVTIKICHTFIWRLLCRLQCLRWPTCCALNESNCTPMMLCLKRPTLPCGFLCADFASVLCALPHSLRLMYLHAWQSRLWNLAASHRVQVGKYMREGASCDIQRGGLT